MDYYYDSEFLEDGFTIELLSLGIVAGDGREYYAVSADFRLDRLLTEPWLLANVVPSLPISVGRDADDNPITIAWDTDHPDWAAVKPRAEIAVEVRDFLLAADPPALYAWYADYDHVVLCQLWGRMIDLPEGLPKLTLDLKQEVVRLGNPRVPAQATGAHNALADARHNAVVHQFLRTVTAGEGWTEPMTLVGGA